MKRFIIFTISALTLWGCTNDLFDKDDAAVIYDPSKVVTFSTGPVTRGTPITSVTQMTDMGVFASYTGQNDWTNADAPNKMYNRKLNRNVATGAWEYDGTPEEWDAAIATDRFSFFAYAPFASSDNGIAMVSAASTGGIPVLRYTVPTDVLKQHDLMVAVPRKNVYKTHNAISLQMEHTLTSIGFQIMGNGEKIKSLSITGISIQAQLAMDGDNIAWTNYAPVTNVDFSSSINYDAGKDYYTTTQILSTNLMKGNGYLMMIPQTLGDDAALKVTYDDGTFTSISLKNNQWQAGKKLTYNISGDRILVISEPSVFKYYGNTQDISITSTLRSVSGAIEPVAWKAEFSIDGGSTYSAIAPAWLNNFPGFATGGNPSVYSISVKHQPFNSTNSEDLALRNASPKGIEANPYDLSTSGGIHQKFTANSYIVNSPGYYQLPLVYGNAIKNGAANTSAYTSIHPGDATHLHSLTNHLGIPISNPYLYNNTGVVPDNAVLIWQSSYELVSSVQLDAAKQNLIFEVKQDRILQGNAVVAVRDALNNILWSWHIWVTPLVDALNPATDQTWNHQGFHDYFMQYNLGFQTRGGSIYYQDNSFVGERKVTVKITQTGVSNPLTQTFELRQENVTANRDAYRNVFWQWGRKDPFMYHTDGSTTDRLYYEDTNYTLITDEAPVSIATAIRRPFMFYVNNPTTGTGNWTTNDYGNLWSMNNKLFTNNDDIVVKTIYDPSPVGFKMPASNAFSGFSKNGAYATATDINAIGPFDVGWNFIIKSPSTTSYYPATNAITTSLTVSPSLGSGSYWTAGPYSAAKQNGYSLNFSSFYTYPISPNFYRAYGLAVRPVMD